MDDKYLELEYGELKIIVKVDEEGVVLDVWKDGEVVATKTKTYEDFGVVLTAVSKT